MRLRGVYGHEVSKEVTKYSLLNSWMSWEEVTEAVNNIAKRIQKTNVKRFNPVCREFF